MDNLYEILEVSKNASDEVIQKAYKVLVKRYHPDVAINKDVSENMIKKINYAYNILSDKQKRHEYDMQLLQEKINVNKDMEYVKYAEDTGAQQYNEPVKSINIDNRILVALIIIAGVLFIFSCISLFGTIGEIINKGNKDNSNINSSEYINDDTSKYVIENIAKGFVNFNVEEISNNIVNTQIFKEEEVKIIKENLDIYNQILPDIKINVTEIKATNQTAQLTVSITRNDVENIYIQYYFARGLGFNKLTPSKERQLLLQSISDNSKETTQTDRFIAKKIDNQWKFELTNTNIIYLIGMSISKYVDIFKLIN